MVRVGGKKSFIDKKNSTTYNLIYRASEVPVDGEENEPERQLVDSRLGIGIGRVDEESVSAAANSSRDFRFGPNHPLAWMQEPQDNISEQRRQELIQLGYPDDGYDYLKHLRAAGRGGTAQLTGGVATIEEQILGPSVFVAAPQYPAQLEDDEKTFDATQLVIHEPATDDVSAAQAAGGVTAFSRPRQHVPKADALELAELSAAMEALEDDSEGDLEDDFLLTATEAGEEAEPSQGASAAEGLAVAEGDDEDSASESGSYTDFSGSEEDREPSARGRADAAFGGDDRESEGGDGPRRRGGPGSIASTYWRPERTDRKNLLSVLDERFEHLALDYDEDDIGELEEDDPDVTGVGSTADFGGALDEFLASRYSGGETRAGPGGAHYRSAAEESRNAPPKDAAIAAATVAKAKEALRAAELAEFTGQRRETELVVMPADHLRERWDCESVLSLRSNLDNHPGRISEPARRPRAPRGTSQLGSSVGAAQITLSTKTGLPLGSHRSGGGAGVAPLTEKELGRRAVPEGSVMSVQSRRGETAEEKKARKGAVKEGNRQARAAKKELKVMFKDELIKQQRAMATPAPATIPLP